MKTTNGLISTAFRLKVNNLMKDDCDLLYRVVETHQHYCVLEVFPNKENFSCELMTYDAMLNENWEVIGEAY